MTLKDTHKLEVLWNKYLKLLLEINLEVFDYTYFVIIHNVSSFEEWIITPLGWISNHINYVYQNQNKIKSLAYSSQGSHTGQLNFSSWLADGIKTG